MDIRILMILLARTFLLAGGYDFEGLKAALQGTTEQLNAAVASGLRTFWEQASDDTMEMIDEDEINLVIELLKGSGMNDALEPDGEAGEQLKLAINNLLGQIGEEPLAETELPAEEESAEENEEAAA
jgi:hypothetical protein